jgi:hypothetical protein
MTDDLDALEAIAKRAQEHYPCPWWAVEMMEGDPDRDLEDYVLDDHDKRVASPASSPVAAEHIAAFSPDVVLRLIRVAKAALEWRRYAHAYERRGLDEKELLAALEALEPE